nr:hypothetical protein [Tanacetum cinerariifolium]
MSRWRCEGVCRGSCGDDIDGGVVMLCRGDDSDEGGCRDGCGDDNDGGVAMVCRGDDGDEVVMWWRLGGWCGWRWCGSSGDDDDDNGVSAGEECQW